MSRFLKSRLFSLTFQIQVTFYEYHVFSVHIAKFELHTFATVREARDRLYNVSSDSLARPDGKFSVLNTLRAKWYKNPREDVGGYIEEQNESVCVCARQ